jgi:transcriptional antiterminator NusG
LVGLAEVHPAGNKIVVGVAANRDVQSGECNVTVEPESSFDPPGDQPAEPQQSPAQPELESASTEGGEQQAEASVREPQDEMLTDLSPANAEAVSHDSNRGDADASAEDEPADEEEEEDDQPFVPAEPLEFIDESADDQNLSFDWYILKVQVNREDSIKEALLRKVRLNGLERYFKEVVVPTEDVAEFTKTGKRRVVKRKIYPGYILVNMAINDDSWFIVRETPGIGDFTGAGGKPSPMDPKDVERILRSSKVIADEDVSVKTAIPFKTGDRVRVKEGYFQNFEGDVDAIDQANGRVTVMINIFGRSTPVELEHWQIEMV